MVDNWQRASDRSKSSSSDFRKMGLTIWCYLSDTYVYERLGGGDEIQICQ